MGGRCQYIVLNEGGEEEGDEGRAGALGLRRRWELAGEPAVGKGVSHDLI